MAWEHRLGFQHGTGFMKFSEQNKENHESRHFSNIGRNAGYSKTETSLRWPRRLPDNVLSLSVGGRQQSVTMKVLKVFPPVSHKGVRSDTSRGKDWVFRELKS